MRAYETTQTVNIFLQEGTRILIRGNRALISVPASDLSSIRDLLVPAEDRVRAAVEGPSLGSDRLT